jgi:2-(3-amino-3-carboxypropyl)histidine synthase
LPKKNIDVILYFGDGFFHPYALDKKILTYRIFPFEEIIEIKKDTNKLINMLPFMIKDKKVFGIFISSKLGQSKLDLALKIKKLLEKNKKEVYLLTGDNVNYEKLIGLNLEVLVNTACPRIIDDYKNYKVILVNPETILNTFK